MSRRSRLGHRERETHVRAGWAANYVFHRLVVDAEMMSPSWFWRSRLEPSDSSWTRSDRRVRRVVAGAVRRTLMPSIPEARNAMVTRSSSTNSSKPAHGFGRAPFAAPTFATPDW